MYKLKAESWGVLTDHNSIYAVIENPVTTHDFSEINGKEMEIDGQVYVVKGVNRFAHCAPWSQGERIAVLVEKIGNEK